MLGVNIIGEDGASTSLTPRRATRSTASAIDEEDSKIDDVNVHLDFQDERRLPEAPSDVSSR